MDVFQNSYFSLQRQIFIMGPRIVKFSIGRISKILMFPYFLVN